MLRSESAMPKRAVTTEGSQRALQTTGVLSGGSAAGEREPGGGGDVSDAAHAHGAAEGARGGGWGPALREDEPGDAANGGWQGVCALRREVRRELRGGQAASDGVT